MCYLLDAGENPQLQKVRENPGRHARRLYVTPEFRNGLMDSEIFGPFLAVWVLLGLSITDQ